MSSTETTAFLLNGEAAEAAPEETVLHVARSRGVQVPTLCHHAALQPYGACRLCVVEVAQGQRVRLVTSCNYAPAGGDVVQTDSPRVRRVRAAVAGLLLARCPDAAVLQSLVAEYGSPDEGFQPSDEKVGPDGCILCGLCVRVCAEAIGRHAIGYAFRGAARRVSSPFQAPTEACIGCGACVFVCPTGALHAQDLGGERTMVEFGTRVPLFTCRSCGQAFATVPQMNALREQNRLPRALLNLCPDCRRAEARSRAATLLTLPPAESTR